MSLRACTGDTGNIKGVNKLASVVQIWSDNFDHNFLKRGKSEPFEEGILIAVGTTNFSET